jgi:cytosine/adenosine deaminase-related metal-dependent hydrolase
MGPIHLAGGTLIELRPPRVRRADLVLDGGRIASVGGTAPEGARRIDAAGAIVLPGLACAHLHLARGAEAPLEGAAIEAAALRGAIAAAKAGVTTLVDHHDSIGAVAVDGALDRVAAALERVGLRGVLSYAVTDRHGESHARAALAENDRFLSSLRGRTRPLLRGLVGAHAGATLGHATTVALADLAVRHDTGVHLHVGDSAGDATHVVPVREATIVEWLEQYRLLRPRSLLVNCAHVDDAGAERIAASGSFAVHLARDNEREGAPYARPGRFRERLLLGVEGPVADLLGEARAAALAARAHDHPFDAAAALARNWSFAAAAFDEGLGRLEAGCPADLAVFPYDPATPIEITNLSDHLLFGLGPVPVRHLFVAGREVVRDGALAG